MGSTLRRTYGQAVRVIKTAAKLEASHKIGFAALRLVNVVPSMYGKAVERWSSRADKRSPERDVGPNGLPLVDTTTTTLTNLTRAFLTNIPPSSASVKKAIEYPQHVSTNSLRRSCQGRQDCQDPIRRFRHMGRRRQELGQRGHARGS